MFYTNNRQKEKQGIFTKKMMKMEKLNIFMEKANKFKQYGFYVFANKSNEEIVLSKKNYARILSYAIFFAGTYFTIKAFYDLATTSIANLTAIQLQLMSGVALLLLAWLSYRSRKDTNVRINYKLKKMFVKNIDDDLINEIEIDLDKDTALDVDSVGDEFEVNAKNKKGYVKRLFNFKKNRKDQKELLEIKEIVSSIHSPSK